MFSQVETDKSCIGCHAEYAERWQASDHAKSMMTPTPQNVLGDFSDVSFTHFTQNARFYKQDDSYWVTIGHQGKTADYAVKYTFGHFPLQQYLVETNAGRIQILPYAWDSRPSAEGGQRWFTIYANEDILPNDRLHWQQPLQNWNGMCADCHSSGLTRNYDVATDQFDTVFSEINVGCQSCHGDLSEHAKNPEPIATHWPSKRRMGSPSS